MKLKEDLKPEVVSIGSDVVEYKSTISEENIPLVLSLVSKGIYRDPISSIVREITSNCIDANEELKERKPILVNIKYDYENENYYIEFIDRGIGMSPERIANIYTSFFSSTKRDSNKLIGGFGLGSKSPLSYTDLFYITTIYDNIKYEYVYFKEGDDFTLSLLNKCNVLEKSGTTIRIDIKRSDENNFLNAAKIQLAYFNDVYVNTNYSTYDNDFVIYEGRYFKFRVSNQPYNSLHILLGQVVYPIDWKILDMDVINIPIAIKFDIGEIHPTLERENIKYTDETKNLLKERIDLVLQELKEYFKDQIFEITDLKEYIQKREDTPYLYFNKEADHKIKAYRKELGKSDYVFKPLEDFNIPNDGSIFFMYNAYRISGLKQNEISLQDFFYSWKREHRIIIKDEGSFSSVNNSYFSNGDIVLVPKKISYREAIIKLGIRSFRYNKGYISYLTDKPSEYEKLHVKNNGYTLELGNSRIIHKYITEIRKYINSISLRYEDVPLEYVENYKAERKKEYLDTKEFEKERVVYRDEWNTYQDIQLKILLKSKYVFYCLKDEDFDIFTYKEIIKRSNFKLDDFMFIRLSNTQYQKIKKYNLIHLSKFLKNDKLNNTLYKIKLANYIQYKLNSKDYCAPERVSIYHYRLFTELREFYHKYNLNLGNIKVNTHKRKINCCWKITKVFKEYMDTIDKFEIFNYINLYHIPKNQLKLIVKIVKLTKLNKDLYK